MSGKTDLGKRKLSKKRQPVTKIESPCRPALGFYFQELVTKYPL